MTDCHELLSMVLPLTGHEREFLERLNGKGEVVPDVLTDDDGCGTSSGHILGCYGKR